MENSIMTRSIASVLVVLSLLAFPAFAQHNHAAMMPAATTDAMSTGVVKQINRKAGEVTITHGPLTNLGMGPMTMSFRLKSPALIEGINEGSRVQFVAENVNGALTVVAMKASK